MKLRLFTTHCPKCKVLETKLKSGKIDYDEWTDVDEFMKKYPDVVSAPQLEVTDGDKVEILDFRNANDFINGLIESAGR